MLEFWDVKSRPRGMYRDGGIGGRMGGGGDREKRRSWKKVEKGNDGNMGDWGF